MRRRSLAVAVLVAATSMAFTSPPVPASDQLVGTVEVADAPLVAEAGDSAFVAPGEPAVFLGTAFGGTPPYTVEWTTTGGAVEDPTNDTAVVDTSDLAADTVHTATISVTDAAGATATDDVLFAVAGGDAGERVPLEPSAGEPTVSDTEPGVFATDSAYEWTFDVPDGLAQLDVTISWDVPANDYDLSVVHDGEEVASSGGAPPATSESAGIPTPTAGTYTVRALRYATVSDPSLSVSVVGTTAADSGSDPRPAISTGGPYEFVLGRDSQELHAAVTGGAAPVSVAWDTDLDGIADDATGPDVVVDLPVGRHLVTAVVTDGSGFERREMTSVTVGRDADHLRELAVPFTVIGVADSGINPYHEEFSAATYPDPEVLELTRNFTRPPSEYLEGYPEDAKPLPISTGEGYFPEKDSYLWSVSEQDDGTFAGDYVETGQLYWIPGTKIIGAIDAGGSTGVTSGDDSHPILDDNGHGTGSTSVSTGNRYGYCPTCLIVLVEALDETVAAGYDWIDISSNSFGAVGGVPLGLALGPDEPTRVAAERGQLTFFAAGNGTGNAFATTPVLTYGSSPNGADWAITVGATREDNQGAIISDGSPVHISALGDGDLPSACRTGDTGQCAFGGTSAATPYTSGAFGMILTRVRDALGDTESGQRPGQVVAEGTPIPDSPYLSDGQLTRAELRAVGLKTAMPRGQGNGPDTTYPFPWTYSGDQSVYFEGYGSSGPAQVERAVAVLLGEMPLPARPDADAFFADDCEYRDSLYGSYDRDGDGKADPCSEAGFARYVGDGPADNSDPTQDDFDAARDGVEDGAVLTEPFTYALHREERYEPDTPAPGMAVGTGTNPADLLETDVCSEEFDEQFMSRTVGEEDGDVELCFDARITSVPAAFRPKGIFTATDQLEGALPAGSQVSATIYMQSSEPTVASLEGVLKATDREVGRSAAVQQPVSPAGWTAFQLDFTTERLVAPGEQLTFHLVHAGARSWAYGYNGDHESVLTITPAGAPDSGNEFGVTIDEVTTTADGIVASGTVAFPDLGPDPQLAGFHHQSLDVQVAVDDFGHPTYAAVDPDAGTWAAMLPASDGSELVVRALRDRFPSETATAAISPTDDGGGDDDGGTGDDPECNKPDKGRCKDRDHGGPPADPGHGNGRGNGNGPKDGQGHGGATATLTAEVAASPASLPARGGALVLWLATAGAVGAVLVTRRRAIRG